MIYVLSYILIGVILLGILFFTKVSIQFCRNKKKETKQWKEYRPEKIENMGSIKNLSILPLSDYYTDSDEFIGESGVSYLLKADDKRILFDVGFNRKGEHPSPLAHNMKKLGIELSDTDFVFISHLHVDHVGGLEPKKNRSFSISAKEVDMKGIKAYVPEEMTHKTAEIEVIKEPKVISEGIASIGTISRSIWGMGLTEEHSLAIHVEGKGLVLIIGCGHQSIEKIIKRTEELFDIPIYGVFGGLHFPVTKRKDFVFNIRRVLGTGKWPFQGITKYEVIQSTNNLLNKNLSMIGISPHDSCDWTLHHFKGLYGPKYKEIIVGNEICID